MATITLTSKGQLTIPRQLREELGLAAGAKLQASIDAHGRLVLVLSCYEPEDLFRHRRRRGEPRSLRCAPSPPTWWCGC